jgi:hypothetical protein
VVIVPTATPPRTARANTAFCSSPGPPIAIGIMPTIMAAAVISTGRKRVTPADSAASKALMPASRCSRAKVTSRIEFADAIPIAIMAPISEGTCFAISAPTESGYWGFYSLDFAKVRASYNEQKGLLLRIPASVNDGGSEKSVGDIKVRINRKNDNSVTIEGE